MIFMVMETESELGGMILSTGWEFPTRTANWLAASKAGNCEEVNDPVDKTSAIAVALRIVKAPRIGRAFDLKALSRPKDSAAKVLNNTILATAIAHMAGFTMAAKPAWKATMGPTAWVILGAVEAAAQLAAAEEEAVAVVEEGDKR
jgi:hypothetical protein